MFTRTLALVEPARLAARLPDFVALTKPRVMALAVFTALVGLCITPAGTSVRGSI